MAISPNGKNMVLAMGQGGIKRLDLDLRGKIPKITDITGEKQLPGIADGQPSELGMGGGDAAAEQQQGSLQRCSPAVSSAWQQTSQNHRSQHENPPPPSLLVATAS
jgi:hypothetical protein